MSTHRTIVYPALPATVPLSCRFFATWATVVCIAAAMAAPDSAWAQSRPRQNSSLYYRLGGGDPAARPGNTGAVGMQLGLGGAIRLNYSCGKFDLGLSWSTLMNSFSAIGTQVGNAVKAGIAALPLYILQRAQPGLYQLFQTYAAKADVQIAAALKSCEEMEAQIKAGGDPYESWLNLAKGEGWKATASLDVVAAKQQVTADLGKAGLTWINGIRKGGENQRPIEVVGDIVKAGYNVTLNQGVGAATNIDYSAPGNPLNLQRLTRAFKSADRAATYAADVLGEMFVATCDNVFCPAKGTRTGLGLSPKMEAEVQPIRASMNVLLASPLPDAVNLDAVNAPGVAITREVIESLRELPPLERGIAADRLTREVAMAVTIDKALVIRDVLLTGLTIPEVSAATPAVTEAEKKIKRLDEYINSLMFENRVRRDIVSATAGLLIDARNTIRGQSSTVPQGVNPDKRPLEGGRVQ